MNRIVKFDDEKRIVFGWFSVTEEDGKVVVDKEGDVIESEVLEVAAYDFVMKSRVGGVNHTEQVVGILVESMVFTKDKQEALGIDLNKIGWWGGFKILSDDVWKAIKDGKFEAFSIGGRGKREAV